jgi:branched-chain amino acid transport system substrate-binding protein
MKGARRFRAVLCCVLPLAAASLAACGSSGGSGSGTASNKTPIDVYWLTSFPGPGKPAIPEVPAAMNAEIDAVNASGGVHGRPLHLIVCDDDSVAEQSRTCAQQAASNPNALAALFTISSFEDVQVGITQAVDMPEIGIIAASQEAESCAACFPLVGGGFVDSVAAAVMLDAYDHLKHIAILEPQFSGALTAVNAIKQTFLPLDPGSTVAQALPNAAAADLSSYVEANKSAQGVAVLDAWPQFQEWLSSAHSLGLHMQYAWLDNLLSPQSLQQGGAALNGTLIASDTQLPTSNVPGAKEFRATIAKYEPGTAIDEDALEGWMSVKMFADVARSVKGNLTRAAIVAALDRLRNYSFGGLIPPYSTNVPFKGFGGTAPRLFNTDVAPAVIENGKVQPLGSEFIDPFTGQKVSG